jgi:phosphatidylinositol kinase/protein kinase (PI-3  family)
MDNFFLSRYRRDIDHARQLYEENTKESLQEMWDHLSDLCESIQNSIDRLNLIFLAKISESFAKRRGFAFAIPGTHDLLEYVEPAMEILTTKEHPRVTILTGKSGEHVKFLLKGNGDLRLDERLMQFFSLLNSLLKQSRIDVNLGIATYPILPLTMDTGLIKWVTGGETLDSIVVEHRKARKLSEQGELDRIAEFTDCSFSALGGLQRAEAFEFVAQEWRALELFESSWITSPNSSVWYQRTERFTVSSGLMSVVGYVIGLGDRHPGNIMVQRDTGLIIHIDFRDSFDAARSRIVNRERVPFRLSRMMVNACAGSTVDGLYGTTCVRVVRFMRKHEVPLGAQLATFLNEPLDLAALKLGASRKQLLDNVMMKLGGTDVADDAKESTPEEQATELIRIASDPRNYVRHFPGWCPFW